MPERNSLSISFVALGPNAKLSLSEIQKNLTTTWKGIPTPTEVEEKNNSLSFRVGEPGVIIGKMEAPIPDPNLDKLCEASWLWPNAKQEIAKHTDHLIVSVILENDPIKRSTLLMQSTAAIIGTCDAVLGVYWCDSKLFISPPMFREFAVKVLPSGPPWHLWINPRVGNNGDGTSSGYTTGMTVFGLLELETSNAPKRPSALQERLLELAFYLFDKGPVVKHGESIGNGVDEMIDVTVGPSSFGHEGNVMRLSFRTLPKRKPWWRRWLPGR